MDVQDKARVTLRQTPVGDTASAVDPADAGGAEAAHIAPAGGGGEALVRLTMALRAGLHESGQGPDLLSGQMRSDADPFEFFASPARPPQADSSAQRTQDLPRESLSGSASIVERKVALMAQDMAAFGGAGREAPLRLDPAGDGLRHEYFA